jgi:hypothetical protein
MSRTKRTHKFNRVNAMALIQALQTNWGDWIVTKGMGDSELADLINAMKLPALKNATTVTPAIVRGALKDLQALDPDKYTRPRIRRPASATWSAA